jgi:nicotinamidase-related amidase
MVSTTTKQASHTALLLLDLQNAMVDPAGKIGAGGLAKVVKERRVLENARAALQAARAAGAVVVYVRLGFRADYADALSVAPRIEKLKASGAAVLGTWDTEFPESIAPQSGELVIAKQCVNPFFGTGLLNWLLHRGVRRLALAGVVTNLVVESTARAADDAGFAVIVLEDCCAAPNPDWHRFSIEQILPLFGTVLSSAQFAAEFA